MYYHFHFGCFRIGASTRQNKILMLKKYGLDGADKIHFFRKLKKDYGI
jgi:hypothetical protein